MKMLLTSSKAREFVATDSSPELIFQQVDLCRSIACVTKGSVSMLDLAAAAVRRNESADVMLTTWRIQGDDEKIALREFASIPAISGFTLVCDSRMPVQHPEFCKQLVVMHGPGSIRTTRIHAKICSVIGTRSFAIRGSVNLLTEPVLENVAIDESAEMAEFYRSILSEIQPWNGLTG